jgi:hypothetical protein
MTKLPHRRQFLHLATGAATLPTMSRIVWAQTALPQSKIGTRLITLGTTAGPVPKAHRAQSSNLLVVNGAFYLLTLATEWRAGLPKLELMSGILEPSSSPIIMMITRRGSER